MHALLALFFLAQPFWEAKAPEQWTNGELDMLRANSPWAQTVLPNPAVLVYLATAAPIEEAEVELRARGKNASAPDADYLTFLSSHRDEYFVLAIPYANSDRIGKPEDEKRMVEETVMLVGRKQVKIAGHFPPVAGDPVLRLVFPREVHASDKRVVFRLYLPGIQFPDREVVFQVKDLIYHGELAM